VIHACYGKNSGNVRFVRLRKNCGKGERAVAFNQQGRPGVAGAQGLAGTPGTPGTAGAKGERGPQGPGASEFSTSLEQKPGKVVLATLDNGVTVLGRCGSGEAELELTAKGANGLQLSGTSQGGLSFGQYDASGIQFASAAASLYVDFDMIARDVTVGRFARISVHGTHAATCSFWGMIIPSG
jgi:hypothetical protein